MFNKKLIIDSLKNLSKPSRMTNKNTFDLKESGSKREGFVSAQEGVETPIYKAVKTGASPIEGKGLFAEQSIRKGDVIGVSHIRKKFMKNGEEYKAPFPSTVLGYYNHSEEPNVYEVDKGDYILMVAGRDIQRGHEITSDYNKHNIEDLEVPEDFKKGGSIKRPSLPNRKSPRSYSRSFEATNKLFAQNPLFAKAKSRKNKIFDPRAQYFDNGGESEEPCPEGYAFNPKTGECIEWNPTVWESNDEPTSYDPVGDIIYMNPNDRSPDMTDDQYKQFYNNELEHEQLHRLQWVNGELKGRTGTPLRMPSTVDNQNYDGDHYYNRRSEEESDLGNYWMNTHPNEAPFIPGDMLYNKKINPDLYDTPGMSEWEARDYEIATGDGMPSLFPKRKFGGLHKFVEGGEPTSPEEWGQQIKDIEDQIGNPSGWTLSDYNTLQNKLNEYKSWRENTPEGQAVIDTHNEEREYDIPLPEHLQDYTNAMMKARLAYANEFGNPAAKRMINIPDETYEFTGDEPGAGVPAGNIGTHFMSSIDNYAVPFIQQGPNGLYYNQNAGPEDKEAIKFDSDEDANYFAEHYKDVSPGFINEKKEGGASEQKIIFSPMEGGCPEGQYWTGTECKIIPKNTKIVYSEEELAKSNISKKEQQKLYNQYITRVNNHNAFDAARLKKYGPIKSKDKYYKTFESIPKTGWDPWMSYGSSRLLKDPNYDFSYIDEQMVPFKQWKKMMDKSSVKPIGFKGNPGGGHFYPIYEKPSNYLLGYNKEEPVIPTTRTVYIDCPPGSVSNGQKTDVTTHDPDSPGNYLRTITMGCDPVKEEVVVPTKEPVINKQESPLIEPMGTQDYPEELEGSNWEWDRKYHSFTTPRLNKHFPLGPLFNGKKKHTFSTPSLHRRKDYKEGGSMEMDLTREQINEFKNGGLIKAADGYTTGAGDKSSITATPFDFRSSYGQIGNYHKNPNYSLTYTNPKLFKKMDAASNALSFTLGRPYNTDAASLTNPTLDFSDNTNWDYNSNGWEDNPAYQNFWQNATAGGNNAATFNSYQAAQNLASLKPKYKKGLPLIADVGYDLVGSAFGSSSSGPFTGTASLHAGYAPESGLYGNFDASMLGVFGRRKHGQKIRPNRYYNEGLTRQGDMAFIPKLNIFNAQIKQRPDYNKVQEDEVLRLMEQDRINGTQTARLYQYKMDSQDPFDFSLVSPELTFQAKPFKNFPGVFSATGGLRLNFQGGKEREGVPITPNLYGNVRYTIPLGEAKRQISARMPDRRNYQNDEEREETETETETNGKSTFDEDIQLNFDGQGVGKANCRDGYERPCEKCKCQKINIPASYTDKRGKHLFGNESIRFKQGGISLQLTKDEIQKYVDGGYVVEDLPKANKGKISKTVKKITRSNYNPLSIPIKKIGERIARQHSSPSRSRGEIATALFKPHKYTAQYFGQAATLPVEYGIGKRDLIANYFSGNETGFEPIDYDIKSDSGLFAAIEEYGPLKTYMLNSAISHGESLDFFNDIARRNGDRNMFIRGTDGRYIGNQSMMTYHKPDYPFVLDDMHIQSTLLGIDRPLSQLYSFELERILKLDPQALSEFSYKTKQSLNQLFEQYGKDSIPFEIDPLERKPNFSYNPQFKFGTSPVGPRDNVGGHMAFLQRTPEKEFQLTTRDLWGFRPEAYDKKWGMNNSFQRAQTQLMDAFGKPFVLTQTNPIKLKQGGETEYELGGIIEDEETKKYLESIGYTFETI